MGVFFVYFGYKRLTVMESNYSCVFTRRHIYGIINAYFLVVCKWMEWTMAGGIDDDRADALETIVEKAGILIVPSLILNNRKRQCIDGNVKLQ